MLNFDLGISSAKMNTHVELDFLKQDALTLSTEWEYEAYETRKLGFWGRLGT